MNVDNQNLYNGIVNIDQQHNVQLVCMARTSRLYHYQNADTADTVL